LASPRSIPCDLQTRLTVWLVSDQSHWRMQMA
jgi:hypothetical protein